MQKTIRVDKYFSPECGACVYSNLALIDMSNLFNKNGWRMVLNLYNTLDQKTPIAPEPLITLPMTFIYSLDENDKETFLFKLVGNIDLKSLQEAMETVGYDKLDLECIMAHVKWFQYYNMLPAVATNIEDVPEWFSKEIINAQQLIAEKYPKLSEMNNVQSNSTSQ